MGSWILKKMDAWSVFFATPPKKNQWLCSSNFPDIFTTRWTFCLKAGQKLKRQNVKTYYERQATWESAQSQNPWSNVALWLKSVFLCCSENLSDWNYEIGIQQPGNAMLLFLTISTVTNHALPRKRSIILFLLIIFFDIPKKQKLGKFPVLNDFQRRIEGVRSSRHGHFKAMPHFCKPGHSGSRLTASGSEGPFEGWKMGGSEPLGQRAGENKTNPYNLEFRRYRSP